MAHTTGPWRISGAQMKTRNGNVHALIEHGHSGSHDPLIAEVYGPTCEGSELDRDANARLIAAAPDLLAACEAALPILHAYIHPDQFDGHAAQALVLIRDAIARAKGT